jgi:hypothetical protein
MTEHSKLHWENYNSYKLSWCKDCRRELQQALLSSVSTPVIISTCDTFNHSHSGTYSGANVYAKLSATWCRQRPITWKLTNSSRLSLLEELKRFQ